MIVSNKLKYILTHILSQNKVWEKKEQSTLSWEKESAILVPMVALFE